jgi:ABC-2 type transport system ATP-binding protein
LRPRSGAPFRQNPGVATAEPAVSVRGLRKSYGAVEVVRGIDLEIAPGEVFAFLGPNGAGKTTTVEILEGYRRRDAGDVRVLGADPGHPTRAWRERLGVVLQTSGVEPELTVRETVEKYAGYYPHPRGVDETVELVGLADARGTRAGRLSGGQQRRLDVALALVGDPDLLFLDEPTTGFDPSARRTAWRLVHDLRALGKTVFLTTHYMDEAQALADRLAIIANGVLVAEGTPDAVGGRDSAGSAVRFRLPPDARSDGLDVPAAADGGYAVTVADPVPLLHALTTWSLDRGVPLLDLTVSRPSLEDMYLRLTGATP